MKRICIAVLGTVLATLLIAAAPQEKQLAGMSRQERMRLMTEMMKDTTAIHVMMNQIASDAKLRMSMTHMMMHRMRGDSLSQREMAGAMMEDPGMHSMIQTMMGGMMTSGGMMNHNMMHGRSSTATPDSSQRSQHAHRHTVE